MLKPGIDYIGVSVSFFCHDGKEFILHKRSDKCRDEIGKWDFGGGQLEFGENLYEAVFREVMEEYGVKGKIEKQLVPYSLIRKIDNKKSHWLIIPHIVKVDKIKVVNNDPVKISKLGWFNLNKLPKPLHTGALYTINNYKGEFNRYF